MGPNFAIFKKNCHSIYQAVGYHSDQYFMKRPLFQNLRVVTIKTLYDIIMCNKYICLKIDLQKNTVSSKWQISVFWRSGSVVKGAGADTGLQKARGGGGGGLDIC